MALGKWGLEYAIDVDDFPGLEDSVEVVRLWVEDGGPATCFIRPDSLTEPEMFGMLMVDAVRHGARAFSQDLGIDEDEALKRIWQGLDAERATNTTSPKTLRDFERDKGGLN